MTSPHRAPLFARVSIKGLRLPFADGTRHHLRFRHTATASVHAYASDTVIYSDCYTTIHERHSASAIGHQRLATCWLIRLGFV